MRLLPGYGEVRLAQVFLDGSLSFWFPSTASASFWVGLLQVSASRVKDLNSVLTNLQSSLDPVHVYHLCTGIPSRRGAGFLVGPKKNQNQNFSLSFSLISFSLFTVTMLVASPVVSFLFTLWFSVNVRGMKKMFLFLWCCLNHQQRKVSKNFLGSALAKTPYQHVLVRTAAFCHRLQFSSSFCRGGKKSGNVIRSSDEISAEQIFFFFF